MTPLLASNFSFHQKDHKSTVKSSLREIWQCYNLTNNFYTVKPLLRYSYICITLWDRHSHVNLSIMQRQQVAFPYFSMTLLAALLRSNRMVNNVPFSSRPHTLTTSNGKSKVEWSRLRLCVLFQFVAPGLQSTVTWTYHKATLTVQGGKISIASLKGRKYRKK